MQGRIKQIIGPVVDVEFSGNLPSIFHALEVESPAGEPGARLVLEVQQHLSGRLVRAVAMSSTDGLKRGAKVTNTGGPITVPVGKESLGRMYNVIGEPIDGLGPPKTKKGLPL